MAPPGDDELQETLIRLIEPFVESDGMELVELQLSGGRQKRVLRLFVDKPGGITVDECAHVSRTVGDLLDTHDPIPGRYVLQVSSPGLTRELRSERDFTRALGRRVRLIVEGGREYVGTLEVCDSGELIVAHEGERSSIPLSDVRKANLQLD